MLALFAYDLNQFVMMSAEVSQDLHQRYWQDFWPWLSVFLLCNCLVLFRKYPKVIFGYVSMSWLFLGLVYFRLYFSEVHTFADWIMTLFIIQALALFVFKVLFSQAPANHLTTKTFKPVKSLGLLIFICSAFLPVSMLLENSKNTILLFGWGAEQTAIGTIGLVMFFHHQRKELLLTLIPLLWLCFYFLFM